MLRLLKTITKVLPGSSALLLFISSITFQTYVFADFQDQTAEQYRALGYAEQQKGNLNEALAYYTKATSMGINNPILLNDMGVLYEKIDFYGKAEQYYMNAIKVDPKYLPAYMNVAYLYQRLGRNEEAAQYFKLRYELGNPNDSWAQKAKEELIKIRPDYADWVNRLEAQSMNRDLEAQSQEEFYQRVKSGQEHYERGQKFFDKGEYEEALREYDQALKLAPKNPKIDNARKMAVLEIAKKSVREQSEMALRRLEAGDTVSARYEIQKMLATIPDKPMLISW